MSASRQLHAGRAAVDHAADRRAVALAEVGDAKQVAEGAAGHACRSSKTTPPPGGGWQGCIEFYELRSTACSSRGSLRLLDRPVADVGLEHAVLEVLAVDHRLGDVVERDHAHQRALAHHRHVARMAAEHHAAHFVDLGLGRAGQRMVVHHRAHEGRCRRCRRCAPPPGSLRGRSACRPARRGPSPPASRCRARPSSSPRRRAADRVHGVQRAALDAQDVADFHGVLSSGCRMARDQYSPQCRATTPARITWRPTAMPGYSDPGFDTLALHAGAAPDPATGARAVPIHLTHLVRVREQRPRGVAVQHGALRPRLQPHPQPDQRGARGARRRARRRRRRDRHRQRPGRAAPGDRHARRRRLAHRRQRALYGGSHNLLHYTLPRFGIETTFVKPGDIDGWRAAIRPNTRLLFGETLGNPGLDVLDIPTVARDRARARPAAAGRLDLHDAVADEAVRPRRRPGLSTRRPSSCRATAR